MRSVFFLYNFFYGNCQECQKNDAALMPLHFPYFEHGPECLRPRVKQHFAANKIT
jgi:hypothetical protein